MDYFSLLENSNNCFKEDSEAIFKNHNYESKSHKCILSKYNDLKMTILDKANVGSLVKVNLLKSRDRLTKEIVDAINVSSVCKIRDFRITDGKGIGVVLELSNGKEQWFFEDEIDLLDDNGNVIKNINNKGESKSLIFDF